MEQDDLLDADDAGQAELAVWDVYRSLEYLKSPPSTHNEVHVRHI